MVDLLNNKIASLHKAIKTNDVTVYYGRKCVQKSNSTFRLTVTLDSRLKPYTCVFYSGYMIEWIGGYNLGESLIYLYDFENYENNKVKLNSTEEELFQRSLIEENVMSYENLQKINQIMCYALAKAKK